MQVNKISSEAVQDLLKFNDRPALTIYIPTHRQPSPPFMQEDQTRLKNSLRTAREKWVEAGYDEADINDPIQEIENLIEDLDFWRQTTEGLAIFIANNEIKVYHLPIECEELVYAGKGFNLIPFSLVLSQNQPYYLLAVAMSDPKIYKGDIYGLEKLDIELPENLTDALNIDEMHAKSKTVRSHQVGGASNNKGEGDSSEAGQEEKLKYFRLIEQALVGNNDFDDKLPIILAGTDNEVGDFKANIKLPQVLEDSYIAGNHLNTPMHELHRLAYPIIVENCIEPKAQEMTNRFGDVSGTGKSSIDLDEIDQAASEGRVDSLLLALIDMTNDSVSDAKTEAAPLIRNPEQANCEQIIGIVKKVLVNGGTIVAVEPDKCLPEGETVGAIYRY